jgi:nitrite reductase/ring-hydroxylating ferredoxin subunit
MMSDALTPLRLPGQPGDLGRGEAVRFQVMVYGVMRDAFVVRAGGALRAYLNTCRHQARPLDMGDGRFFDATGALLVCRHHGAHYEASTGQCVEGPCEGAALTALRLEERKDGLWCVGLAV